MGISFLKITISNRMKGEKKMKARFISLMVMLMVASFSFAQTITLATYNVRLGIASDGENAWPNRADKVSALLKFHEVDIFGLQEPFRNQIDDVQAQLPNFNWVGVGRDDGADKGEFSPIFFNKEKFKMLDKGWFWLSETPEKPGYGWDAKYNRICTYVLLKDSKDNRFWVFNTHLDHQAPTARRESVKLILSRIEEKVGKNEPIFLMGDFNSTPLDEPIQIITKTLSDSRAISKEAPYGPEGTFNDFDYNSKLESRIDYIFVNEKIEILKYGVLTDSYNQHFPSDHLPVLIKAKL